MGDIADMMLDGILDEQTGEFIDDEESRKGGPGYPRTMQPGNYNSIGKKKTKRNIKHALKGQSVGGLHLVGKTVFTEEYGYCEILDYVGKKGKKRYILLDSAENKHSVKFSKLIFD